MFPICRIDNQGDEARQGSHPFDLPTKHIVIAAGGVEVEPQSLKSQLGAFDSVIAADGGYRLLREMGLDCHLLIGDFDTLSKQEVEEARAQGVSTRAFPTDKAKSDLELAIEAAIELGATHISLIGALGGETDHCLTNFLSPLSLCADRNVWARLLNSDSQVYLTSEPVKIRALDHRISLVALSPRITGLSLEGFQYPLQDATLSRSHTVGLANRTQAEESFVSFQDGELFLTLLHP